VKAIQTEICSVETVLLEDSCLACVVNSAKIQWEYYVGHDLNVDFLDMIEGGSWGCELHWPLGLGFNAQRPSLLNVARLGLRVKTEPEGIFRTPRHADTFTRRSVI